MAESSTTSSIPRKLPIIGVPDGLARLGGPVLSAVRIVVSFLFLCHGAQGIFGVLGGIDGHGTPAAVGSFPTWWASLIELVGGGLVLVGLFTWPMALLCSGTMAYAYFMVHQPMGLFPLHNMGEKAALFSWIFLLIAVLGPGPFALDNALHRPRERQMAG